MEAREIHYDSRLDALEGIHAQLDSVLAECDVDPESEVAGALKLAAVEAVTNVIRHAHQADGRPARIEVSVSGPTIELRIYDTGDGRGPTFEAPRDLPDPLAESGRGLFLIQALTDEQWYGRAPTGENVCRLRKRLSA